MTHHAAGMMGVDNLSEVLCQIVSRHEDAMQMNQDHFLQLGPLAENKVADLDVARSFGGMIVL